MTVAITAAVGEQRMGEVAGWPAYEVGESLRRLRGEGPVLAS